MKSWLKPVFEHLSEPLLFCSLLSAPKIAHPVFLSRLWRLLLDTLEPSCYFSFLFLAFSASPSWRAMRAQLWFSFSRLTVLLSPALAQGALVLGSQLPTWHLHLWGFPEASQPKRSPKALVLPSDFPILTTATPSHKAKWWGTVPDPSLLHIPYIQPTYRMSLFLQNYPKAVRSFQFSKDYLTVSQLGPLFPLPPSLLHSLFDRWPSTLMSTINLLKILWWLPIPMNIKLIS